VIGSDGHQVVDCPIQVGMNIGNQAFEIVVAGDPNILERKTPGVAGHSSRGYAVELRLNNGIGCRHNYAQLQTPTQRVVIPNLRIDHF
jgi:hypothetical protein